MSVLEATGDIFHQEGWEVDHDNRILAFMPRVDAIGHGVNCVGVMGSGIAVAFRTKFPEMYIKYQRMCDEAFLRPGMAYPWLTIAENGERTCIYNIASQFKPGANAKLEFLDAGLYYTKFHMLQKGYRHLALPRIGAGIGGLKWEDVKELVRDHFAAEKNINVTLVSLDN